MNDRKQKKKEEIAKALIWKFDQNYDPEPVIQWFQYEDGQVAKISKKNKEGLDQLKLYNKRSQYHYLDQSVFPYHKQVIKEHGEFSQKV